ncbi:tripartite tricarboxylate transporter TctB family protein [Mitsuaria sp. GD03876]|uniref:tripartite tricarboxylate transporter TctB family protein n=1 Tax=Mitsuaria sp. GD03876 TaxID=2975399 RepID=UPI002446F653|nr:tripartite tricarboxylate transporter TctB family protein [Mitsuaria sp. GD03876]MDH0864633.1 tripartite tricarboxylate transporter TctB family protein [Mitsuaria sp. GD03876]
MSDSSSLPDDVDSTPTPLYQTLVGVAAVAVGGVMAFGASAIPSDAGYSGIGPNALPWFVAAVLLVCGAWLIWEARSGGFRSMEPPSGAPKADWLSAAWVAGGVVANAALITTIGFVLACTLCFMLAVRGLRRAEGKGHGGPRQILLDAVTGLLIAAPVFWLFNKLLALNLPAITAGGWL